MRRSLYAYSTSWNFYPILMTNIPQLSILFIPYVIYIWWINQRKLSKFIYDSRHRIIDIERRNNWLKFPPVNYKKYTIKEMDSHE